MSEADAGTKPRALGWHQGAVVPLHSDGPLVELWRPGFDHTVVASQDCDIVASVSTEPNVDLIPDMLRREPDGSLQHGKHPRQLCLALGDERFLLVDLRHRTRRCFHLGKEARGQGAVHSAPKGRLWELVGFETHSTHARRIRVRTAGLGGRSWERAR